MSRRDFIQVEGIEELKKNLAEFLPGEVNKIARNAVVAVANELRDDIRAHIPSNVAHYRTKIATYRPRLTRSGGAAAHVVAKRDKPKGFYIANIVESGTKERFTKKGKRRGKVQAQPFIRPAAERLRQRMPGAFEKHFNAKVTEAWDKRRTGA